MSEKRFTYDKPLVAFSKGGINDNVTGETYEFTMDTVLDLLNGQQATISYLNERITELLQYIKKLHRRDDGMMSEKRYFKIEYDEEWYLFDSTTISEQLVKEQAEYGYGVFANSLSPSEVVELLNILHQENQELQEKIMKVKQSNNHYYTEYYKIKEENEQLRQQVQNAKELAVENDVQYQICRKEKEDFQNMCEQLRHELDSLSGCYCADNKEFKDYWRIGYDD